MNHRRVPAARAYGVLGIAGLLGFAYPEPVTVAAGAAAPAGNAPDQIMLTGSVYDFLEAHADFNVVPREGFGHYAGNVAVELDSWRPDFIGLGAAEFDALDSGPPAFSGPLGYDAPFGSTTGDADKKQIAMKVSLPGTVTVSSISAYVGMKDKEVRFAIYDDDGGKPGDLVVETDKAKSAKDTMEWLTLPVGSIVLTPGDYWLAMGLNDKNQHYSYANSGSTVHVVDHDAKDGFLSTWGVSDATMSRRIAIYAMTADASSLHQFGHDTPLPVLVDRVEKKQIATRATMPEAGKLLSITAYVGNKDKDVRYAIYSDEGGEPGSRLAETLPEETAKDTMGWLTLYVPDLPLTPGEYWLALSFEEKDQAMTVDAPGGHTRYKSHEAAKNGFLSTWGSSEQSSTERVAIYGTYTTDDAPLSYNGFKVTQQWRDAQARPIAPHIAGVGSDEAIDFEIVDQAVVPEGDFFVELRVLGAAIQSGSSGYHKPVTMMLDVGGSIFEPFGSFDDAVYGNLNDEQEITCNRNGANPRCSVIPGSFPAGTHVHVYGRSWSLDGANGCVPGHWEVAREVATVDNDVQLEVLRNGDPVPEIPALYEQDSIADYVGEYIDLDTGTMDLGENQVIYLFELGTSGGSSSADFQDLVVLVTLAGNPTGLCGASPPVGTALCGVPFGDDEGEAEPAGEIDASGGISSADSFSDWFRSLPGVNLVVMHTITLVDDGSGVFEYLTDEFHPIDERGLGNHGDSHNFYFTYAITAEFTYESCAGQFIEFEGADDAWLFVNDRLVLDLGGMRPGTSQTVVMDRLGLEDDATTEVRFFYAQRQSTVASFNLRTNIRLNTSGQSEVSDPYD